MGIFFILFLLSISIYPEPNLIVDSDFENGSTAWNLWGGATRLKLGANSGSYAVSAGDNSGAIQTITGLTPNATYLLTGWLKSSNTAPVSLGVKWYGGNELVKQTTSSSYSQLTLKFTTGPASTTAVLYAYNPVGGSNTMYVDDLS